MDRYRLRVMLILLACTPEIEIPQGLDTLDPENQAAWPEDMAEGLNVVGGVESDDLLWAHARGYIHAPLEDVWDGLQEPLVVLDRGEVDEWEHIGEEEGYDVSFVLHCVSYNIADVDWDMAYRQSAVAGTADEPEMVAVRAERIEGSAFFPELLTWSLHLREVDEGVTQWEFVEHMLSLQNSSEPIEAFADALYVDAHAWAHGEDLPDVTEDE